MQFALVNHIRIAYERRGSGVPLVLLHGFPLDHSIWELILPWIDNKADLILPDLRGFGKSDGPDGTYTMEVLASDVFGILDYLKIAKAVIAGHSMGGYIALAFARLYPDRLLGLGLISTQATADTQERKSGRYETAESVEERGVGRHYAT